MNLKLALIKTLWWLVHKVIPREWLRRPRFPTTAFGWILSLRHAPAVINWLLLGVHPSTGRYANLKAAVIWLVTICVIFLFGMTAHAVTYAQGFPVPAPAPAPAPGPTIVNVTVTPPPPDLQETVATYVMFMAVGIYDGAGIPIDFSQSLLGAPNIYTDTPDDIVLGLSGAPEIRNALRIGALSILAIIVVIGGAQITFGSISGVPTWMFVLPGIVLGFAFVWFSDDILRWGLGSNRAINQTIGAANLNTFTGNSMRLPQLPTMTSVITPLSAGFLASVVLAGVYGLILLLLLLKLWERLVILIILATAMPLAFVTWVLPQTRALGQPIIVQFFGWLFSQVFLVICLKLASSLLSIATGMPDMGQTLLKLGILLAGYRLIGFPAHASIPGGGLIEIIAITKLLGARAAAVASLVKGGGSSAPAPRPAAAGA